MHQSHTSQLRRLRRIEGQVRGITKMVEDSRYCVEILTQLRAVHAALRRVEEEILRTHVQSCLADAARSGKRELQNAKITELVDVIGWFGK